MLTRRAALAAGAALAAMSCCAGTAAAAAPGALAPPAVPRSAHVVGALPGSTPLKLTIALEPSDPAGLAAYAAAVGDPSSPDYHHYLSVREFAARFGASAAAIGAVSGALRARGLDPGTLSANGLSLPVSAPASAVGSALSTSFERVAVSGRTAYVNTDAPSLGGATGQVQGIIGLSSLAVARPLGLGHAAPHASVLGPALSVDDAVAHTTPSGGPSPCSTAITATSRFPITYTADQLASAYSFGGLYSAGDLGGGQTVAVYELEGNFPSDITAFESCYGIGAGVSYQPVDGGGGTPVPNQDGVETELDVENVIGLAPDANVIVYQGPNSGNGPYDTYNAIISGDHAKVVTTSWGECEQEEGAGPAAAENTLFEEAAIQGQTVVAASGDNGTEDCADPTTRVPTIESVDDPSSQPFVTGVGGSSLPSLTHAQPETVWNNGPSGPGATGGGNSTLWPMPYYQTDANPTLGVVNANSSSTVCTTTSGDCREVPDVSADADPETGYLVYYDGNGAPTDSLAWTGDGGTSAAAPLWAALFALADASSGCTSAPIGFANPALYGAAGSTAASSMFNDVTSGNNDWLGATHGLFAATAGYDQATGLGTPIASNLVPALCAGPISLKAPAPQTTIAGTAATLQLTASAGSGTITYAASGLPPGLSVNPATGLISGTTTTTGVDQVTVSATTPTQTVDVQFQWTVSNATVTLAPVAEQHGALGVAASLQLSASSNNGGAITYAASGLPAGMSLNPQTGVITGTPSVAGTANVTVSAAATGATTGVASFSWAIVGPPALGRVSLSGVRAGTPSLQMSFTAGIDAGAIRQISFTLPAGLSFVTAKRDLSKGTSVTGGSFSTSIAHGRLTITLRPQRTRTTVKVRPPALRASDSLRRYLTTHRSRQLSFFVRVLDALATQTTLPASVKAS